MWRITNTNLTGASAPSFLEANMIDSLSRKEVEDLLVDELLDYIRQELNDGNTEVLESYFRKGFKGFENEPVDELQDEYRRVFGSDIELTN
jgi:20S proteasome alpha/beta subunit